MNETGTPGWFVPAFGKPSDTADQRISVLGLVRRQWLWFAAVPLLFAVVAFVLASRAPKIYESKALLVATESEQQGGLLGSIAGQLGTLAPLLGSGAAGGEQRRALAIMRSRSFTDRFLREQGLLPFIFADRWDAALATWRSDEPSGDEAFERFTRQMRFITADRASGFIELSMRSTDRHAAAAWVTAFVTQLNLHMRALAQKDAAKNLRFLQDELARTTVTGTQQALYQLMQTQIRNQMLANVREEYALTVIDPPTVAAVDRYVSPRRYLIVVLAFFAGSILACVIAFWRELARRVSRV
jgi:capsule polysaccharide export protein KpsE/RkpR